MSMDNSINPKNKSHVFLWLIVFGFVIICTIILRIFQWTNVTTTIPLLTQSPELIQLTKTEDISKYTQTPVSLPTSLFGSELFVIGVYPKLTGDFFDGSVAFVYTKNNYRIVELDILTKGYLLEQKAIYNQFPQESITIKSQNDGLLVYLRSGFDCVKSQKNHPGLCQISKILFFEKENQLYKLSVDGDHLSDGEIIEMARSIK